MEDIVSCLWLMSLQACLLIIFVLAARVLLKKYPKVLSYSLWLLVGVRLLCPVFIESPFSLQPDYEQVFETEEVENAQTVEKQSEPQLENRTETALPVEKLKTEALNTNGQNISNQPELMESKDVLIDATEAAVEQANAVVEKNDLKLVLTILYLVGCLGFVIVYAVRYLFVCNRLRTVVKQEQNIWLSDKVTSPFVIGVIYPKIILPYGLTETEEHYIVLHEKMHIRHKDPLIRYVGVLCLCLHWWNPLVWLAVHYMNKDMEMYCDEAVLKEAEAGERKEYAETLLAFAARQSGFSVGLAFGESNAGQRIKNIVKKKRQSRIMIGVVGIASVIGVIALLTIPEQEKKISGADNGGIVTITPIAESSAETVTVMPELTNPPVQKKRAHVFSKSEVFATTPVIDYSFEKAKKLGTMRVVKGNAPGTGECIWYLPVVNGVAYYWCQLIDEQEAKLYSYAIFSEEYPLANGIRVGMTKEEVLSLYPDMAVVDIQGTAYEEDAAWNLGFDSTCYPESLEGQDEKLNYNGKKYWYWQDQFDSCLLAEIDGETSQGRAMALALMIKADKVEAITFYCSNDGVVTPAEWQVSIPNLWNVNAPKRPELSMTSHLTLEETELSETERKILTKYLSILSDLLKEEKLPDGSESGAMLDIQTDSFSICDVDLDGRDELVLWHVAPDTEAYMQAYIWEYDPVTDTLHVEAQITPFFKLFEHGVLVVKPNQNHSYASQMGRYMTPYTIYQYNADLDSYQAGVTVEAWDKYFYAEGFPEEADVDGNGMVYCFTEDGIWQDDAAFLSWYDTFFGKLAECVLERFELTEENIEALAKLQ